MKVISRKKILVCSSSESGQNITQKFIDEGFDVEHYSAIEFELLDDPEIEKQLNYYLQNLSSIAWVIFSSPKAIAFFSEAHMNKIPGQNLLFEKPVALVGKKTVLAFKKHFPTWQITIIVENLQQALGLIQLKTSDSPTTVLHFTSLQSLTNIPVTIPQEINLVRIPIYQTVASKAMDSSQTKKISATKFDFILFTSPSSFEYFIEVFGNSPITNKETQLMTLGKSTAQFIEKHGYSVAIIPDKPDVESVIQLIK